MRPFFPPRTPLAMPMRAQFNRADGIGGARRREGGKAGLEMGATATDARAFKDPENRARNIFIIVPARVIRGAGDTIELIAGSETFRAYFRSVG